MKFISILLFSAALFSVSSCNKDCKGSSNGNCICIEIYDPVCGCDNKTYGNSCEAECNGITDYTEGECGLL